MAHTLKYCWILGSHTKLNNCDRQLQMSSPLQAQFMREKPKKKRKISRMSFLLVLDVKSMLKQYKVEWLYKMNGHVKSDDGTYKAEFHSTVLENRMSCALGRRHTVGSFAVVWNTEFIFHAAYQQCLSHLKSSDRCLNNSQQVFASYGQVCDPCIPETEET